MDEISVFVQQPLTPISFVTERLQLRTLSFPFCNLFVNPLNITIVQAHAPTPDYYDNKIEGFYDQLWQGICGPFCNDDTNQRGLRLLEFATFNNLVFVNTFGHHKASRRWTQHSPNGQDHNKIDYILVRKRIRSGVNIARTRSFPGADTGSDQDLQMMTFHLCLKPWCNPLWLTGLKAPTN